jgi:hypothetical protein
VQRFYQPYSSARHQYISHDEALPNQREQAGPQSNDLLT